MTDLRVIEAACAIIVGTYLVVRLRGAPDRARTARRLGLLALASWLGEDSVMRAYDFYRYSPGWHLFVDRTPLMIVLIWPVVIDSAGLLARRILGDRHPRAPLLTAAFVLADASLIEPIAVAAGLWGWRAPGLFAVPPIGILGWAFFALAVAMVFSRHDRARDGVGRSWTADAVVLVLAPVATHAMLVAAWWGALRWISRPIAAWPVVIAAWAILAIAAAIAWRRRLRHRIPLAEILIRVPAASFFFVLLALCADASDDRAALAAYAVAFAPPYLALVGFDNQRR